MQLAQTSAELSGVERKLSLAVASHADEANARREFQAEMRETRKRREAKERDTPGRRESVLTRESLELETILRSIGKSDDKPDTKVIRDEAASPSRRETISAAAASVASSAASAAEDGVNYLERAIGIDLDGDGDVGQKGKQPAAALPEP